MKMNALLIALLFAVVPEQATDAGTFPLPQRPDPSAIRVGGERMVWHRVTLDLTGPTADEQDRDPNPFTDYRLTVTFTHPDGTQYSIPGFFAADGNAAETSATAGDQWRVHFTPDRPGKWNYSVSMVRGPGVAIDSASTGDPVQPIDGKAGSIEIVPSNRGGTDLRSHGRLDYVGRRYLRHAGSGQYFLKIGADAPETLLAFADFDGTLANKKKVPLKTYRAHLDDWQEGDPTWQVDKGKGLIGAINYLSSTGANAFSFLTYNAGGDGDNVWPFVVRNEKRHYDCSKLDQWEIVFQHATTRGMFLHFKLQETEMDDNRGKGSGKDGSIPTSLDGGDLGPERKLYCRELVARFGHHLALNWNLGEENTQSTAQQIAMIDFLDQVDAYDHPIVVHTYPDQQEKVYLGLLGNRSRLFGASLQNGSINDTHRDTLRWVRASEASGRPWIVAFDESGNAAHGQPPDLGYQGFDGRDRKGNWIYTEHEVRQRTLWGNLMAGGAGCEYYFGYQLAENDLVAEDWRSRDRSWKYGHLAVQFFKRELPFWEMENRNALIGNEDDSNAGYCLAKPGHIYALYLPTAGLSETPPAQLDLTDAAGVYSVRWFDPRQGGPLKQGSVATVNGSATVSIGRPPRQAGNLGLNTNDWVALIRRIPTDD